MPGAGLMWRATPLSDKDEIMEFLNRMHAGRLLAKKLGEYANRSDVIVLALPRGGVPVAYEVANALNAPLDVFLVRKLGVPGHEELAMGAIASGGVRVMNKYLVESLGISDLLIDEVAANEQRELERRERLYRGSEKALELAGRTVIVVDDGLATGSTMTAAVDAIKRMKPAEIVVAAPVASDDACAFFNAPGRFKLRVLHEPANPSTESVDGTEIFDRLPMLKSVIC